MPPQSRGMPQRPSPYLSKSTPNLPTLRSIETSSGSNSSSATASIRQPTPQPRQSPPGTRRSVSEAHSIEDFSLDPGNEPPSLADDEEGSEEEDVEKVGHVPPRPLHFHPSKSHTYLG